MAPRKSLKKTEAEEKTTSSTVVPPRKCKCDQRARKFVSKKSDKPFYVCPLKSKEAPTERRCDFFEWEDPEETTREEDPRITEAKKQGRKCDCDFDAKPFIAKKNTPEEYIFFSCGNNFKNSNGKWAKGCNFWIRDD